MNSSAIETKRYFNNYIESFCKENTKDKDIFYYEYDNDYLSCTLFKKTLIINKGYIWDTIKYHTSEYAFFSICYFSTHYTNNINMLCGKQININNKLLSNYDSVIKELKTHSKFIHIKD